IGGSNLMPEQHAILSASGAHRWLNCTPSARLEEQIPEKTSGYADEGRLAHKIAELLLRKHYTIMKPSIFKKELSVLENDPLYHKEMQSHTQAYLEYIKDTTAAFPS